VAKLENEITSLEIDKKSAHEYYKLKNEILKKNKKLFEKNAISGLDYEKYKTDTITAKLKVSSLSAKINSLKNQKKQFLANISGLNKKLQRYTIIAPIDGYVIKKYISNYAIINPNQTIVDIVNPNDVWVATYIDTRLSGKVKIGNMQLLIRSG